ncbi:MAG: 30S ribosomal protein S6 [Deltaproteobacteria bacterium]|nr:30S ribosomal protein S6 [Candidatus Anaeroferrophillus wilburensis]MBN2888133.1 30S ribosomal protein S6 [Deltaproteobacteria bacterium]
MVQEVRKYELLYIHPGALDEEGVKKVEDRLAEIIEQYGARIFYREDWGVQKLAYRVKKHEEGRYILLRFSGTVDCLRELERRIKIMDEVIKFITVRLDDDFDESTGRRPTAQGAADESAAEETAQSDADVNEEEDAEQED